MKEIEHFSNISISTYLKRIALVHMQAAETQVQVVQGIQPIGTGIQAHMKRFWGLLHLIS